MEACEVCGNELAAGRPRCPHCGAKTDGPLQDMIIQVNRTVNLERGMPLVAQALTRLEQEIERGRMDKVAILTIIHGYGSSGKGGAIRQECRRLLAYLQSKGKIRGMIAGENFARKAGPTRELLRRFPEMKQSDNLNRGNRGITLVLLH